MIKFLLLTGTITATALASFAQQADKALARVQYSFIHIQDTTQRLQPQTENMLLVVGKNASVYTSYDKINETIAMQKAMKEAQQNQGVFTVQSGMAVTMAAPAFIKKPASTTDYFFFVKENKFFVKERLLSSYLVEEEPQKISWQLTKDTANFSGISCQKATARFKGRNWIAWYAPAYPFHTGPWKLNGLPGLIIEAYDEKKEVQFKFAGIEAVKDENTSQAPPADSGVKLRSGFMPTANFFEPAETYLGSNIQLPQNAVKTSRKALDKLKITMEKDPEGFMRAQMGAGMAMPRMANATGMAMPIAVTPLIQENNPIEIPEKK